MDVQPDAWFADSVYTLQANNVISGYQDGSFGPGDPVTRGQLTKIATKAVDVVTPSIIFDFTGSVGQTATGEFGKAAVCGNAVIDGSDQCDDGNTIDNDGCTSTCTYERGYNCSGEPSVCTPEPVTTPKAVDTTGLEGGIIEGPEPGEGSSGQFAIPSEGDSALIDTTISPFGDTGERDIDLTDLDHGQLLEAMREMITLIDAARLAEVIKDVADVVDDTGLKIPKKVEAEFEIHRLDEELDEDETGLIGSGGWKAFMVRDREGTMGEFNIYVTARPPLLIGESKLGVEGELDVDLNLIIPDKEWDEGGDQAKIATEGQIEIDLILIPDEEWDEDEGGKAIQGRINVDLILIPDEEWDEGDEGSPVKAKGEVDVDLILLPEDEEWFEDDEAESITINKEVEVELILLPPDEEWDDGDDGTLVSEPEVEVELILLPPDEEWLDDDGSVVDSEANIEVDLILLPVEDDEEWQDDQAPKVAANVEVEVDLILLPVEDDEEWQEGEPAKVKVAKVDAKVELILLPVEDDDEWNEGLLPDSNVKVAVNLVLPQKATEVIQRDGPDVSKYVEELEDKLAELGDDAQLDNVDLENMLQDQQQVLQMMSNMAKLMHDTMIAVIRKIGGSGGGYKKPQAVDDASKKIELEGFMKMGIEDPLDSIKRVEEDQKKISTGFIDVDESNPFLPYIVAAKQKGWISGHDDGTFRSGDAVTREQAAKIIVGAFGFASVTPSTQTFSDVPRDTWSYSDVETLVHLGIINGYPDRTFKPGNILNRAEISVMAVKAMKAIR